MSYVLGVWEPATMFSYCILLIDVMSNYLDVSVFLSMRLFLFHPLVK